MRPLKFSCKKLVVCCGGETRAIAMLQRNHDRKIIRLNTSQENNACSTDGVITEVQTWRWNANKSKLTTCCLRNSSKLFTFIPSFYNCISILFSYTTLFRSLTEFEIKADELFRAKHATVEIFMQKVGGVLWRRDESNCNVAKESRSEDHTFEH